MHSSLGTGEWVGWVGQGGRGVLGGGIRGILIYLKLLCIIFHSLQLALYLSKEILILLICDGTSVKTCITMDNYNFLKFLGSLNFLCLDPRI